MHDGNASECCHGGEVGRGGGSLERGQGIL